MTTPIESFGELDSLFHELEEIARSADYSEALEDFQSTIAAQETSMFAGEHDSSDTTWEPLKPSTVKRKGHSKILFETGELKESLVNVGGAGNISATSSHELIFGTDVPYAAFHQDGSTRMPARSPVGMSEETLDKLCNRIAETTVEILKGQ